MKYKLTLQLASDSIPEAVILVHCKIFGNPQFVHYQPERCETTFLYVISIYSGKHSGHVARMGEVRGAYNILVGRPEGRRPLGRPRHR
jgi:hypothetical protein